MNASLLPQQKRLETARQPGLVPVATRIAPAEHWGPAQTRPPADWTLSTLAGRVVELSGSPSGTCLTLAFCLLLESQQQGEPTAWVTARKSVFFPPDAARAGIALDALAVVKTATATEAARAAEHLLRSGAFGLVVSDLGTNTVLPPHAQVRLAAQARQHAAILLCLTEKESHRPSIGSLVSLRAHTSRTRHGHGGLDCRARILKDKHRGPGWIHVEACRGPDGLC
jgi:recombination protein RecA